MARIMLNLEGAEWRKLTFQGLTLSWMVFLLQDSPCLRSVPDKIPEC